MNKPGRPRMYAGKMVATIGVRAPEGLANAMFILAQRKGTDVSEITRAAWIRILRHERLLNENCEPEPNDALLTT